MYKFKIVEIKKQEKLVLVVEDIDTTLLNFCTIVKAKYFWKNSLVEDRNPYTSNELNELKKEYQESLSKEILKSGYIYVDISTGKIISPDRVKHFQILEEFEAPLPF